MVKFFVLKVVLYFPSGKAVGELILTEASVNSDLEIKGDLSGESISDGKHGFHIHQEGKLTNDCKDAGGHYNPDNVR